MMAFQAITAAEEGLFVPVGIGLALFLAFCLWSLFRMVGYLRKAPRITPFWLLLVVGAVLSVLSVFADLALLHDIGKQYRHGLPQPEWTLLFAMMVFQLTTAVLFVYLHLFGFKARGQIRHVARDSNVFLLVQYVGVTCGFLGLVSSALGFVYPKAWTLLVHTTIGPIVLLTPYALVTGYWLRTKLQETHRRWCDEKQMQDVGKSALMTLAISAIFMTGLFAVHYNNLDGVVRLLWLPLYLFLVLFLFSTGNLYFSGKE